MTRVPAVLLSILLICLFNPRVLASTENIHSTNNTLAFGISQRAQEETGYASGFYISDFSVASLLAPALEIELRIRLLTSYGPSTVLNFASSSPSTQTGSTTSNGLDRPLIRARQLIYGDFSNGRWFIAELGLPFFNATGYTPQLYRYSSGHVAFHEQLIDRIVNPYFELGATVRSLTQVQEPGNVELIYPPTIEGLAGLQKTVRKVRLATDLAIEQALTETSVAGSFDLTKDKPAGASTTLKFAFDSGYAFSDKFQLYIRYAQRVYRWPDDDSAALWSTFEEASLGRSFEIQWRGEW